MREIFRKHCKQAASSVARSGDFPYRGEISPRDVELEWILLRPQAALVPVRCVVTGAGGGPHVLGSAETQFLSPPFVFSTGQG